MIRNKKDIPSSTLCSDRLLLLITTSIASTEWDRIL